MKPKPEFKKAKSVGFALAQETSKNASDRPLLVKAKSAPVIGNAGLFAESCLTFDEFKQLFRNIKDYKDDLEEVLNLKSFKQFELIRRQQFASNRFIFEPAHVLLEHVFRTLFKREGKDLDCLAQVSKKLKLRDLKFNRSSSSISPNLVKPPKPISSILSKNLPSSRHLPPPRPPSIRTRTNSKFSDETLKKNKSNPESRCFGTQTSTNANSLSNQETLGNLSAERKLSMAMKKISELEISLGSKCNELSQQQTTIELNDVEITSLKKRLKAFQELEATNRDIIIKLDAENSTLKQVSENLKSSYCKSLDTISSLEESNFNLQQESLKNQPLRIEASQDSLEDSVDFSTNSLNPNVLERKEESIKVLRTTLDDLR